MIKDTIRQFEHQSSQIKSTLDGLASEAHTLENIHTGLEGERIALSNERVDIEKRSKALKDREVKADDLYELSLTRIKEAEEAKLALEVIQTRLTNQESDLNERQAAVEGKEASIKERMTKVSTLEQDKALLLVKDEDITKREALIKADIAVDRTRKIALDKREEEIAKKEEQLKKVDLTAKV